ncbi:OmpH family outer membrane protein [Sphingomonas abietis]|uniref:OmpH family outer membrane protein n=1 Tax=Sphingomonas abietis TaxID=3012344 RepID=A0ABY7NRN5_9SPHN|nr:OmpH family outer membrane protein [Sphingomonas abietis]WBO24189.1 OmpH family outer membrane protein [Sphingomonas abietis]
MTKMFKSAMLAATAAVSFTAVPAFAADTAGGTLVVDFDQVFQNSAAGKSASSQISAKYQPIGTQRKAAFDSAVAAYNAQVEAVKKATKPGTQPQGTPALQAAGQRVQQAQDSAEQLNQEVNQVVSYVRSQIVDHARPVAEQIRGEKKAAVVISKDSALASDPANDITATLIQRLDTSFPTASIVLPQQSAGQAPAASNPQAPQGR